MFAKSANLELQSSDLNGCFGLTAVLDPEQVKGSKVRTAVVHLNSLNDRLEPKAALLTNPYFLLRGYGFSESKAHL